MIDAGNLIANDSFEWYTPESTSAVRSPRWPVVGVNKNLYGWTVEGTNNSVLQGLSFGNHGHIGLEMIGSPGEYLTLSQVVKATAGQQINISMDVFGLETPQYLDIYYNNVLLGTSHGLYTAFKHEAFTATAVDGGVLKIVNRHQLGPYNSWNLGVIDGTSLNTNWGLGLANVQVHYNSASGDTVDAGSGNDTVFGSIGDDTINGGADNDWLIGDKGNDTLKGGDGDDTLQGDDGNDRLDAGGGVNWLEGAAGNDVFVFGPDNGTDYVVEFVIGEDKIDLSTLTGSYDITSANFASKVNFWDDGSGHWIANIDGAGEIHIQKLSGGSSLGLSDFVL